MLTYDREHFLAVMLDSKNNIIGVNDVSVGSLSTSVVHPREVYKAAIGLNAAAIMFLHNHPSGDCAPSREDRECTQRLYEAGKILGERNWIWTMQHAPVRVSISKNWWNCI